MRNKILTQLGLGLGLCAALAGCGGASNNDQGASFRLAGYNGTDEQGVCVDKGITAAILPLANIVDGAFSGTGACMKLETILTTQSIRTDRAFFSYYIPGASAQPPDTSIPFTVTLGKFGTTTVAEVIAGLDYLPAEIMAWLSLNINSLPDAPFNLEVYTTVSGVTTAGDRLESNTIGLLVQVLPDVPVNPNVDSGAGNSELAGDPTAESGDILE